MMLNNYYRRMLAGLIAIGVSCASAQAGLIHRYSFKDAKDSVGKVDAKLKGTASVADGKLTLKNEDGTLSNSEKLSYVEFSEAIIPKGAKTASFVIWFTAKDAAGYSRLINVGDSQAGEGVAFFYYTPRTADDQSRAAITATDVGGRIPLEGDRLDDGKPHMAVIVINGDTKKMHVFIDGKEPKPGEDLGDNTLDKIRPVGNYIGKSSFDNDPGLSATIDEFRVYDNALTAEEVIAIQKAGPDALPAGK